MSSQAEQEQYRKYSMIIEWSNEDQSYIVTVPELPGCRTHGATRVEALERGEEVIEGWIEATHNWGRPVPRPRDFSERAHEEALEAGVIDDEPVQAQV